jgi:hypothetical protein
MGDAASVKTLPMPAGKHLTALLWRSARYAAD